MYCRNGCLIHYGVKGMKWGVRKDRDVKKGSSGKVLYRAKKEGSSIKVTRPKDFVVDDPGFHSEEHVALLNSQHPGAYKAMQSIRLFTSKMSDEPFLTYCIRNDISVTDILERYKRAQIDNDWDALVKVGEEMNDAWNAYTLAVGEDPSLANTIEDNIFLEQMTKAREALNNIQPLPAGASAEIGRLPDGTLGIAYTDPTGETTQVYSANEYSALEKRVEKDRKAKIDYRKRRTTRSREVSVDTNAKPVSVKKNKKIGVSDKERRQKVVNSKAFWDDYNEYMDNAVKYMSSKKQKRVDAYKKNVAAEKKRYEESKKTSDTPLDTKTSDVSKKDVKTGKSFVDKIGDWLKNPLNIQDSEWK